MALMCVQMKLFICHITSDHAISSEIRNVGIEQRKEGQWWCEGIWPAGILGAASFSNCIKSIQFMTPLLAWLLEDKAVRIDEYTVEPIKTRQIHLLMLGNPVAFIADLHSFLTMTPTLGTPGPKDGIVVDVSSMQYESTVRSHRASHYHDTRTRGRHTPEPFGSFFKEHREALEDESSSIEDNQCSFILEAQLRTMNNAIYREAQRLGGRPYLFSMRHWDFVSAMDSIGRVLCGALEELRPRTEDLIFQDRRRDAFQQLVDDCNGEGHRAMNEAAMKRMVAAKTEKKNLGTIHKLPLWCPGDFSIGRVSGLARKVKAESQRTLTQGNYSTPRIDSPNQLPSTSTNQQSTTIQARLNMASFVNPYGCGSFPGTSPESCPNCRDVPDSDIDSTRTSWQCLCGGWCYDHHQIECDRRQISRTIVRLVSLQQKLALVISAATMMKVIYSYSDDPLECFPLDQFIYYKDWSQSAFPEPPFVEGIPEEVKIQACCVENCFFAIATTSPSLAWLVEGMPIKLQEFNAVGNPTKRIAFWRMSATKRDRLSELHTALVMAPDTAEDRNAKSTWEIGPQLVGLWGGAGARVSDATFPQFAFDRNCHTTADYLREKVREYNHPTVLPFGFCIMKHWLYMGQADAIDYRIGAYVREAGTIMANNAVHRETEKLGGRWRFLVQSDHRRFVDSCQQLVMAVEQDLKQLRTEVDKVFFPHGFKPSKEQIEAALSQFVYNLNSRRNIEVMAVLIERLGLGL
ncbi:uncharacterized protein K460DRAFT_418344 [Cucurbitaria berberidis CBS 394.84]|uniref:Uncharacterized protein n=1 Tax=Cucurbitaria berberidis CBS 394.84 TaxID=1168544 RepID=A0A9P4GCY3_9PLEO|nr:uncharacterized protein K460DRAFT_418344 [Cucurbitaria berberidis CBS 394.84]KAF1843241.1 hypothetical protein K460DRAFT_418344 [Cucurbitaria berberidis CBS 394.84]